jgi:exonuclease III
MKQGTPKRKLLGCDEPMRVVAWNCQGGFHKKIDVFKSLRPDLAVISEFSQKCANATRSLGYRVLWFGSNPRKGLAVICREDWAIEAIQALEQKWIAPIRVHTGFTAFTLIAFWACSVGKTKLTQYIGQVYQALISPRDWFSSGQVVMAGDLNSNKIWDSNRPTGNHSAVVKLLEQRGIVSGYHEYFGEEQGKESRASWYLYRHESKPFHLDLVFIPKIWMGRVTSVEVGEFAAWSKHSDHSPVVVEINDDFDKDLR